MVPSQEEGTQMFNVAKGVWTHVEAAAKELMASKEDTAPVKSPDGNPMLYVASDKSKLRLSLMEVEVDGTKIFVGIPVGM